MSVEYNENNHKKEAKSIFTDKNGVVRVNVKCNHCRMKFGIFLRFDKSGENNITRGKERVVYPHIEFDDNGQQRFVGKQNHPRVLQEPYAFPYYGANNDIQKFLINVTDDVEFDNPDYLAEKLQNIGAVGKIGLERFSGADIGIDYSTKYFTKGGMNSDSWNVSQRSMASDYCKKKKEMNEARKPTIRAIISKSMYEVTNQMSITRDQSIYICASGRLVRNSFGTPSKCSVNELPIKDIETKKDDVGVDVGDNEVKSGNSFTWKKVLDQYKKRPASDNNLNLNNFVVFKWKPKKETIPQFFGFNNTPSWPLNENYSMPPP